MSFYILPDEILLIIFSYCDTYNLIRLNGVCKRFYHITSELLDKKSKDLLVTSEMSEIFRKRCQPLLSYYKLKLSTNYNWKHGKYKSKILYSEPLSTNKKLYPDFISTYNDNCWNRLQMTKDEIWFVSKNNTLCAFNRTKNGFVSDDNWVVEECNSEIVDIVSCNDVTVTYHIDGSIRQWTVESLNKKKIFNNILLSSCSDHYAWLGVMDVTSQNIVIGFVEGEIKIWKYMPQENFIAEEKIISKPYPNDSSLRVKLIAFDPTGTKFIAYYESNENFSPDEFYIIHDISKCNTVKHIDREDGYYNVEQVLWEDLNTILLLGADVIIKMDYRTHKAVQKWYAPFECYYTNQKDDKTFTCMSSDNQYAIMTGTSHGQLILWDQRQSAFIQTYEAPHKREDMYNNVDLSNKLGIYNYVDSLKFDSSHMYVATDKIYEFDFTKI